MKPTKPLTRGPAKEIPSSFNESRKSLRFNLALPVNIVRIGGRAVDLPGRTRNLSSRGAYLAVDADIAPDSPIEFIVTLDASREVQLRCQGRVTRIEKLETAGHIGVAAAVLRTRFIREGKTPTEETLLGRSPSPPAGLAV